MTALVLLANANNQKYGIKLPNMTIEKQLGTAHKQTCLLAITTFKQVDFGQDFDPNPNNDSKTNASSE